MLVKRVVDIPLATGLDTKSDPKQAQRLLRLENAYVERSGEVRRRKGGRMLPNKSYIYNLPLTGTLFDRLKKIQSLLPTKGGGLIAYADTAVQTTEDNDMPGTCLQSYLPQAGGWLRNDDDAAPPCSFEVKRLGLVPNAGDSSATDPSLAYGDGYMFGVFEGTAFNDNVILDNETRHILSSDADNAFGSGFQAPKVVYLGSSFIGYAAAPGSATLRRMTRGTTPNETTSATNQFTDLNASGVWDFGKVDDTYSVLAYHDNTGVIRVRRINAAGTNDATVTISRVPVAIGVFSAVDTAGARYTVVVYSVGAALRVTVIDSTWTATTNDVQFSASGGTNSTRITGTRYPSRDDFTTGDALAVFVEISGTGSYNYTVDARIINFAGTQIAASTTAIHHSALASKAWNYRGSPYVMLVHDSVEQPTYYLASLSINSAAGIMRVDCGKVLLDRAGGLRARNSSLSDVVDFGGGLFAFAGLRQERLVSDGAVIEAPVQIDVNLEPLPVQHASLGRSSQYAGGLVRHFDGRATILNHLRYPENVTAADGAAGNPNGAYSYIVTLEWVDRNGELHRSAPSPAIAHTTAGAFRVVLTIPAINRPNSQLAAGVVPRFYAYRTEAGSSGPYYKVPDVTTGGGVDDSAATTVTYTDNTSDADLIDNEQLYTTDDVLGASVVPAAKSIAARHDRMFLIPQDDPTAVWYTKIKADSIAPEFCNLLTLRIEEGGDGQALALIDSNVVVLKRSSIYVFGGAGPNNLGQGSFSTPQRISSEIGCAEPNSVISTKEGVFFKSSRGIYLLTRSLQTVYIGAPVEAYNGETILRATVLDDIEQVRFVTDGGHVLVYDTLEQLWGVYTMTGASDGLAVPDGWHWGTTSGLVYREDDSAPLDKDAALALETQWIKTESLQGYQRLWWIHLLGQIASTVKLRVELMYDYKETVIQTLDLDGESEWRIKPVQQKCSAFKLRLRERDGSKGELRLSALGLTIGTKSSARKLGESKTR